MDVIEKGSAGSNEALDFRGWEVRAVFSSSDSTKGSKPFVSAAFVPKAWDMGLFPSMLSVKLWTCVISSASRRLFASRYHAQSSLLI